MKGSVTRFPCRKRTEVQHTPISRTAANSTHVWKNALPACSTFDVKSLTTHLSCLRWLYLLSAPAPALHPKPQPQPQPRPHPPPYSLASQPHQSSSTLRHLLFC